MSVMEAVVRRQGAMIVERHGTHVAAHYGSAAGEEAVCRTRVGLAERPDRVTLELRGPEAEVERAITDRAVDGGLGWSLRVASRRAILRCERADEEAIARGLIPFEELSILDVSREYVALELIGPFAEQALRAAGVSEEDAVIVLRQRENHLELLVARPYGPAIWNRMLEAGEPFGISCVGLDALERLAVSERASRLRGEAAGEDASAPAPLTDSAPAA